MSTGPQHYREAEQLLGYASELGDEMRGSTRDMSFLAEAQAHATLALAAATALNPCEVGAPEYRAYQGWRAIAENTQGAPAAAPAQVWWLDDGEEHAGKPPLYTDGATARDAAIKLFERDNPFTDTGGFVSWQQSEDEDDAADDAELTVRGRRTGIFVRPIRPKDGA